MSFPLNGSYQIKIGNSIRNKNTSNLVTFRYDFIPQSVQQNPSGDISITNDNSVSVKLPNIPNSDYNFTQYKGNLCESNKECVLIYNKKTNEMVLERLDYVVNLKKIRDSHPPKPVKKSQVPETLSDNSDDAVSSNKEINRNAPLPDSSYTSQPNPSPNTSKKSDDSYKSHTQPSSSNSTNKPSSFVHDLFGDITANDSNIKQWSSNLSDDSSDEEDHRVSKSNNSQIHQQFSNKNNNISEMQTDSAPPNSQPVHTEASYNENKVPANYDSDDSSSSSDESSNSGSSVDSSDNTNGQNVPHNNELINDSNQHHEINNEHNLLISSDEDDDRVMDHETTKPLIDNAMDTDDGNGVDLDDQDDQNYDREIAMARRDLHLSDSDSD